MPRDTWHWIGRAGMSMKPFFVKCSKIFEVFLRCSSSLMQAARSSAPTSVAYLKTQLDFDASRGSISLIPIEYIKMQLVLDARRQE